MQDSNPYDVLGIKPDASDRDIKSAFRRRARLYHPDLNSGKDAMARFIALSEAFEILGDPKRRALFDEFGVESLADGFDASATRQRQRPTTSSSSWPDDSPFESVFEDIHNDDPFQKNFYDLSDHPRGANIEKTLPISLIRSIRGGSKSFEHQGDALAVRIPAGSQTGDRLLVPGEGAPSLHHKGDAGDLWLVLEITTHPRLTVDGNDLYLTLPISMSEAILGARIPITTPHGSVMMTVPEGIHSGAKLRLKEMGIEREHERGDFYLVIEIHTPERITDEIKAAARKLDAGYVTPLREDIVF